MSKTIIGILSDPQSGGDEAVGRMFNALFLATELKERNEPFEIVFQGAGARWPAELAKEGHPAHALYKTLESNIQGVCGGCADVFGATEAVESSTDLKLVRDADVPGTSGVIDMAKHVLEGARLVTF